MNQATQSSDSGADRIVISIDAMGGDRGPAAVVAGIARSAAINDRISFLLHGPEPVLGPLVERWKLTDRVAVRDVDGVVNMTDKPSQVMRHGKGTSMWDTIDAVRDGDAAIAVSCGNTGALMAVSMLRLRKLPGVNRPAIACLWPSRNSTTEFNIMLDVGADIRADAADLLQYALMGVSYARNGLDIAKPRVGLLNVGTEEHKGRAELHEAHELISACANDAQFEFVGYVEGGDIPSSRVDVIVTDGFTGNVALKTGEGTAKLIGDLLRDAFRATPLSRVAALLALTSLRRLNKRIDPRRVNGGVFLGLNGTVIKSHGSADATGVSAAIGLAVRLAESGFTEKLAARVASVHLPSHDAAVAKEEAGEKGPA